MTHSSQLRQTRAGPSVEHHTQTHLANKKGIYQKSTFSPLQANEAATIFSPPRSKALRCLADTDLGWFSFSVELLWQ